MIELSVLNSTAFFLSKINTAGSSLPSMTYGQKASSVVMARSSVEDKKNNISPAKSRRVVRVSSDEGSLVASTLLGTADPDSSFNINRSSSLSNSIPFQSIQSSRGSNYSI